MRHFLPPLRTASVAFVLLQWVVACAGNREVDLNAMTNPGTSNTSTTGSTTTSTGGSGTTTGSLSTSTTGGSTTTSTTGGSTATSTTGGSTTTSGGNGTGGTTQTSFTYQASSAAINNPERGFMKWTDIVNTSDLSFVRAAGDSLGFAVVRLDSYRNGSALPDSFLSQIATGLGNVRAAHIKVILRFTYNYPGSDPDGSATADAPLAVVQAHLNQLAPIIANNVDVIAALQAGFSGQWGEWHDSSSGLDNASSRLAVMNAVLAALPTSRYALIRYPYEKRENWQGPLNAQTAAGTSAGARIGHHNDCFLDGDDNAGTYHSSDDKTYLAADTFYVPMGGETCAVASPYTDCANALSDLATYHWSFLNGDFDSDVLNGWTQQGCMPTVVNNLGYRITLHDASMNPKTTASNGTLQVTIHLTNDGYARMFNQRPVYVALNGPGGRFNYALSNVDPRGWLPGNSATISANVALGTVPAGTYTVALWLPDAASVLQSIPDYAVQCANTGTWDATNGYNVLMSSFTVQ